MSIQQPIAFAVKRSNMSIRHSACIGDNEIAAYLNVSLSEDDIQIVETHLNHCDDCIRRVDEIDAQIDSLGLSGSFGLSWDESDRAPLDTATLGAIAIHTNHHRDFIVPRRLGGYRLGNILGNGAMGVVFAAYREVGDPDAECLENDEEVQPLAMKVLRQTLVAIPEVRERFLRESRIAASLHHRGIVPIYFSGESEGYFYHVMQRIDGCTLRTLMNRISQHSPEDEGASDSSEDSRLNLMAARLRSAVVPRGMAVTAAIDLILQVAEALQYAHSLHVIHRDIKPGNLLIDADGRVHVSDFGLASLKTETDLTATGTFLGTLRYSTLERLEPNQNNDHARQDIGALGLTFYELVTGRPAWDGRTPTAILEQIRRNRPPNIRSIVPGSSVDLDTLFRGCLGFGGRVGSLSHHPQYASMQELIADLRAALNHQPLHLKPPSWWKRLIVRRGTVLAVLLVLFLVVWFKVDRESYVWFAPIDSGTGMSVVRTTVAQSDITTQTDIEVSSGDSTSPTPEPIPEFNGWDWTWKPGQRSGVGDILYPEWIDLIAQVRDVQVNEDDSRRSLVSALKHMKQKEFAIEIDGQNFWVVIPFDLEPPVGTNLMVRGRFQKTRPGNEFGGVRVQFVQYGDVEQFVSNFASIYDSVDQPNGVDVTLFSRLGNEWRLERPPQCVMRPDAAPIEFVLMQLTDQTQLWINRKCVMVHPGLTLHADHSQFYVQNWLVELQKLDWVEVPDSWAESLRVPPDSSEWPDTAKL